MLNASLPSQSPKFDFQPLEPDFEPIELEKLDLKLDNLHRFQPPDDNLHSAVSSCVTISSCVVIPHCVDMSVYGASLLVLVALRQGTFSQTETHMHGEKVCQKIATKFKAAEKGEHCPLVHTAL